MIEVRPDTVQYVRKLHGLDSEERLQAALDILQEWLHKQTHFTKKDFSRDLLEHMLVAAKGSVERTKERLDKICTYRSLMPHFFQDIDPTTLTHHGKILMGFLPRLTSDHTRILILDTYGKEFSVAMYLEFYKYVIMMVGYMQVHDYSSQYDVILDYRHCSLADSILNTSLVDLRSLASILIEGYGTRVRKIHIMTDSKFADIVLNIGKQVVPSKLKNRFEIHNNLETLHKFVEKDVLPVEYGGNEISMQKINDKWIETLSSVEYREFWRRSNKARTDESLRSHCKFNDQYLGTPGSFRALNVD